VQTGIIFDTGDIGAARARLTALRAGGGDQIALCVPIIASVQVNSHRCVTAHHRG
jgi:hypothetical protein